MSGLVTIVLMVNSVCSLTTKMLVTVLSYTNKKTMLDIGLLGKQILLVHVGRIVTITLKTVPGKLMTLLTNLS